MHDEAAQSSGVPQAAQAALEYRQAIMKVRGWCAMLALFGVLAIWQGVQLMQAGVNIAVGGVLVGVVLIVAAIAAGTRPSPATMLLQAIAFASIGAWDLLLTVLSGGEVVDLAIWGVIELGIAIYLLSKLPGFSQIAARKPSDETMRQLDAIAESIRKAKLAEDPDLLEFTADRNKWRVRLADVIATFVEMQKGHDMVFVPREQLVIEDLTKPGKDPKMRPVVIRAGSRSWKTKLKRDDLQLLVTWKTEPAGPFATDPAVGAPGDPDAS
jgi:hypothetical protein